jgi:hypothetical protein
MKVTMANIIRTFLIATTSLFNIVFLRRTDPLSWLWPPYTFGVSFDTENENTEPFCVRPKSDQAG